MEMESVAVVAVPFPAQGHLNQLLHLSLQLAARGLPVHYAAPAEHVLQARARARLGQKRPPPCRVPRAPHLRVRLTPPDPAAASPFPSHLMPLWEAFTASAPAAMAALLREVFASYRRVVVIYDLLNAFVAEEAARVPNAEPYALHCTSVSAILGRMGDGGNALLRCRGLEFLPIDNYMTEEFLEFAIKRGSSDARRRGTRGLRQGAPHPSSPSSSSPLSTATSVLRRCRFLASACAVRVRRTLLRNRRPISMSSLRGEQITELAAALRGSNQRFIWVLRDTDRGNIFVDHDDGSRHARLLAEFTKQVDGRGLVVTGWAPQLEIPAHPATAAFMSHCGWNSTMESMSHGKPILAWPMHSDQPWDAVLVCEYLKAGFLVRPCEKHAEVVPAATIQRVIETFERMMVSDEGRAVRKRAQEVGEAVRASAAASGSSRKDFEDFIAHITR
ncbi:unnamed protein product [Urochloa decumbens]|uniref:Glycosyltransferase N-terminal domain-containing protein n=1 Tax=Urochloa decumbens TaxID=240449 RepID=A0ABC9CCT6_9POAL